MTCMRCVVCVSVVPLGGCVAGPGGFVVVAGAAVVLAVHFAAALSVFAVNSQPLVFSHALPSCFSLHCTTDIRVGLNTERNCRISRRCKHFQNVQTYAPPIGNNKHTDVCANKITTCKLENH